MKNVLIAGAGIIGLSTALELNARGFAVTVVERGRMLEEASWAAAGMLAANDPENPEQLKQLSRFSLAQYPEFLRHIEELSGMAVPLRTRHTVQFGESPDSAECISEKEAAARVPGVRIPAGYSALWLKEESLDPRDLCAALAAAVRGAGIDVREETALLSSSHEDGQIQIVTSQGPHTTDCLIVTTGAWSATSDSSLHTLPSGSVIPRKGQMARVVLAAGEDLQTVLRSPLIYLVPRGAGDDGRSRVVIGATVEDAGFDRTIRPQSTAWLLEQAAKLWGPVARVKENDIEEVWTGIRPGTADHLPIIGTLDSPKILFATGHYRNGILLAPGTAKVVAQLLTGETLPFETAAFSPKRFYKKHAALESMATVGAS